MPDCGISFKALSVMSPRRPTVAFLLKPFLWRRPDVRLRYFFLSPLCGVAKTPDCGIFFFIFICSPFGASLQTPDRCILFPLPYCIFMLYMNNLLACIMDFLFRDWRCDHRIFQSMIIICCIIPMFIMFASTFKVLTGLSLAIVLARFSCMERSVVMTAPEPTQRW